MDFPVTRLWMNKISFVCLIELKKKQKHSLRQKHFSCVPGNLGKLLEQCLLTFSASTLKLNFSIFCLFCCLPFLERYSSAGCSYLEKPAAILAKTFKLFWDFYNYWIRSFETNWENVSSHLVVHISQPSLKAQCVIVILRERSEWRSLEI